jgi:hypothetical protein
MLDAFVAVVSPSGGLEFATFLGSSGDDRAHGVASLGSGKFVFVGQVMAGGTLIEKGFSTGAAGEYDGFVSSVSYTEPREALRFVPVTPCRVIDTRKADGPFGGPQVASGALRTIAIPNSGCGIPTVALAYSVNVAVVPAGPLGYLTLWPAGELQPMASTLNALDGRVKSNATIVPAGVGGSISMFASDATHVVLDITGYFVPASDPSALAFFPVAPCRVADTRTSAGPLGGPSLAAAGARSFPILSACNVPVSAKAYSLNLAVIPRRPLGYLTVWPSGQGQPVAAALNAPTGAVTAGAVIVPAGVSGSVDVFASDPTDLVIDINGYFAPPAAGGLSLYDVAPCRVLDTRKSMPSPFSGKTDVQIAGGGCGVPAAAAYVLTATAVPASSLGYLALWAQGESQANAATLNAIDGTLASNLALVAASSGGISAFASDPTHLVLDLLAYFAP